MGALYLIFSGALVMAVIYLLVAIRVRRNQKRISCEKGVSYEQEFEKPSGLEVFIGIFIPLIIIGPFVYLFLACFADSGEGIFLFLAIIGIILYLALAIALTSRKPKEGHDSVNSSNTNNNPGLDLSTKLMLGAMGAKLLDNQIEKHKKESEQKRKELFFWQDAIRDKERAESGYDHDDWL